MDAAVCLNRLFRPVAAVLLLAVVLSFLTACGNAADDDGEADGRIRIACTTTMIADLARQIVGDKAVVIDIMGPGKDPHVYDVRPRDADQIRAADVVFYNGLHLEATMLPIIQKAKGKTVALAEQPSIKILSDTEDASSSGAPDPHCWMSVPLFKLYVRKAVDALSEADPANAEHYHARADAYLVELDELEAWTREQLELIPADRRVIITSHDAFRYFGDAYGVEVHGLIGISTEAAPTPGDFTALKELVESRGIRALFFETSVSNALNDLVQRVADQTGANVGGSLYSDSLGGPDSGADTYITMMQHNVNTIVKALR